MPAPRADFSQLACFIVWRRKFYEQIMGASFLDQFIKFFISILRWWPRGRWSKDVDCGTPLKKLVKRHGGSELVARASRASSRPTWGHRRPLRTRRRTSSSSRPPLVWQQVGPPSPASFLATLKSRVLPTP